jgi:hypothetical protein
MEQQRPTGLAKGQIPHFVQDDEVHAQHAAGHATGFAETVLNFVCEA